MMHAYQHRIVEALCFAALSACTNLRPVPQNNTIVIDHVTILDGRGGDAVPDARVVVRGDRIISISRSSQPLPPQQHVIDGTGKFLLPGFIDMHAHLLIPRCSTDDGPPQFDWALSARSLARQLDFGITTVRSPATPTKVGLRMRDELNRAQVRGPHAYASAELINDATLSDAQLRQAVRDALVDHPDYFKAYARLQPSHVASLVAEAHKHHIPVIGHLQRTTWMQGVELGIDHLAHAVDWASASLPAAARPAYEQALATRSGFLARINWLEAFDPTSAAHQELLTQLARRRISVDVTLIAYDAKFAQPDKSRYRANPYLHPFPELRDDWTTCDDATEDWTADDYRRWQAAWPNMLAWVRRMHDAGVLLVTGTDLTNEWIAPGDGLHQEFELLFSAGLTANQILRMTGANAAEALHRNDVGVIEPGRRADLVLLAADPRVTISNTRAIVWVMQGGVLVAHGAPH